MWVNYRISDGRIIDIQAERNDVPVDGSDYAWFEGIDRNENMGSLVINGEIVRPIPPRLQSNSVSPLQMRKALRALGLKETIDQYIASQDEETQESWEYAVVIERSNPLIAQAAALLGKTEEEVDQIFELAKTL